MIVIDSKKKNSIFLLNFLIENVNVVRFQLENDEPIFKKLTFVNDFRPGPFHDKSSNIYRERICVYKKKTFDMLLRACRVARIRSTRQSEIGKHPMRSCGKRQLFFLLKNVFCRLLKHFVSLITRYNFHGSNGCATSPT